MLDVDRQTVTGILPRPVGVVGVSKINGGAQLGFAAAMAVAVHRPAVPVSEGDASLSSRPILGLRTGQGGGSAPFSDLIAAAAERAGVDENLIRAVVEAESGFNPSAVSRAGAKGLMQLMDGTAHSLGVEDPFDPSANLAGGAKFLRSLLDKFGSIPLALAAYNAGPAAVERYEGIPPYEETRSYVDKVLRLQRRNQQAAAARLSSDEKGEYRA